MELRNLRGDDLFLILPILAKLIDKGELEAIFKAGENKQGEDPANLGASIISGLIQKALVNIKDIRGELNSLLSELTGESVKKIQTLGISEYTGLIIALFKKPELKEVFTSAALLLTKTAN
jgi:hypothetical protein